MIRAALTQIARPLGRFARPLGRFGRDEGGSFVAEFLMLVPVMAFAYVGLFSFWDAFRTRNSVQKAAYAITDSLTREMEPVDADFLDGLSHVADYLSLGAQRVKLRVTSVLYKGSTGQIIVLWSYSNDEADLPRVLTATISEQTARIPAMASGDSAVIIEAHMPYQPPFGIGMQTNEFSEYIVARPRFVPKIELASFTAASPQVDPGASIGFDSAPIDYGVSSR